MLTDIKLAAQQSCGVLPLAGVAVGKCRLARCFKKMKGDRIHVGV